MLLVIFLVIFGLAALRQGQIKITRSRVVDGDTSRIIGWILLAGAALTLVVDGTLGLAALLIAIIIGLARAKPL